MKRKDEIQKELQELGLEKLANLDLDSGLGVPDGYFEQLEKSILNNLPASDSIHLPKKNKFFTLRMVGSIAASLLILIIFGVSFLFLKNNKENGSLGQIADFEYEEYFASLNDFERLKMKEYLIDLDDFETHQVLYDDDDEHLLDYLMDESNYQKFDPMALIDLDNK